MPTKMWDVRTALAVLYRTALPAAWTVFDGPVARTTPPKQFALVGTDGGFTGTGEELAEGTRVRQKWATLTGSQRQEDGEVTCALWAWSGSTDMRPLRATVAEGLALIEDALRADKKLGTVLAPAGWCELTEIDLWEAQREAGAFVRAAFTVSYEMRLS